MVSGPGLLAEVANHHQLTVRHVQGAALVAQPRREQADVVDHRVHRGVGADVDHQLVTGTVPIFEQHRESGEVVVDLVLTTDGQTSPEEAGAGQEEGGVDVEDVERGDGDHDPHEDRQEVVQHAGGRIDALAAAGLSHLGREIEDRARRGHAPPSRREVGRRALGDMTHEEAQHEPRHPGEQERPDQQAGDGDAGHRARSGPVAANERPRAADGAGEPSELIPSVCPPDLWSEVSKILLTSDHKSGAAAAVGRVGIEPTTREL